MSHDASLPRARRWPLVDRLPPTHELYVQIIAAHEAALETGSPDYVDPASGYVVFTAAALWDRGACCDSGCRHCPYGDGPRQASDGPPGA